MIYVNIMQMQEVGGTISSTFIDSEKQNVDFASMNDCAPHQSSHGGRYSVNTSENQVLLICIALKK